MKLRPLQDRILVKRVEEEAKTKGTPDDVEFVEKCIEEFWRSLKEHNLKINSPERTKQNESSTKRFVV